MELTPKQEEGLRIAVQRHRDKEKYTVISGYAGTGKAQPNTTLIPTPSGYRPLKELKIGDYVFDRNGNKTQILGTYPQGIKQEYKVTLEDGRTTICAEDHLWSYFSSRGNLVTKTIKEMKNNGIRNHDGYKYKIPNNAPVEYEEKEYDIDPYMMGVFLGDGCCTERYLTLSSENDEIPNYIGEIISAKPIKNSEFNYNWTFEWINTTKTVNWIAGNNANRTVERKKPKTIDYFEKYAKYILVPATEKDIPEEYKYGSIEQRFSLLQGLMDTDGSINKSDGNRFNMRFTTTSKLLVESVKEIAYSLGYKASLQVDNRSNKYTNDKCYTISFNIPNEEKYKFFRLKRKKEIAIKAKEFYKRKDYSKISIVDIEALDSYSEMTCIYVDNDEHLYLTNDFIVTHNTTLVKSIIQALNVDPKKVCYATFTGKAAEVLRKKGNENACTLHHLLYDHVPRPGGGFYRKKKEKLDYTIAVVDEVSMVPKDMIDLLFSHKIYCICLGDPFQLPTLYKDDDNHLLDHPHIFLDQIMRQEEGSEIIQLSMKIRNREPLELFKGQNVQVIDKKDLVSGMLTWADQILVAKNTTRIEYNNKVRSLLGYSADPKNGEKVVCLHNYWDIASDKEGDALVNGTIGYLQIPHDKQIFFPKYLKLQCGNSITAINANLLTPEGDIYSNIDWDKHMILTGEPCMEWRDSYALGKIRERIGDLVPKQLAYGYAVTVWKAQGSQWDKILLFEENHPFDQLEHFRYLYTGITRAINKIVVVRK